MLSRLAMADRWRNRDWMCSAIKELPEWANLRVEAHYCTLASEHYGAHRCWCGILFDETGSLWVQPRLPGA